MGMVTHRHRRAMHFVRIDFFDMGDTFDVIVGIPDMIKYEEAEWKGDEE